MASIISKKVNGQTYYYLRQMARVDGKPKMAWERYLGKAEDIEAAVAGSTAVPERTRHLAFGDLAATWSVIKRLGIAEIVDEVVGLDARMLRHRWGPTSRSWSSTESLPRAPSSL